MGKNTDKLYVTATEHSLGSHTANLSGAKGKRSGSAFQRLPFDCCALSLKPFEDLPVCTRDGTVYDLTNIMPYIRKHGTDPVTGKKLASGDLIKLNFFKNAQGNYHDPVSFKVFNEHTPITAIATSGNVFSRDTVESLNIKPGFWRDLVNDTEFARKDLIILQDPHNLEKRDLSQFHYLKNDLKKDDDEGERDPLLDINSAAMGSTAKILAQMQKGKQKESSPAQTPTEKAGEPVANVIDPKKQLANKHIPYNAATHSTGKASASLTSTSSDLATKSDRALIDEEEWMFERILPGEKAYVAMKTNLGTLNIELFCDKAPKTCYNFLMLAREGKYDNTIFHRLIPGFMIQGGDPTGTGSGGASYWGTEFRDEHSLRNAHKHEGRGLLSMANKGADTNSSQFFFTFRATPHLNNKHTVFGKIVGGEEVLDKMEKVTPNPSTDRPTKQIRILDVAIYKDPFDEFKTKLAKKLAREQQDRDSASVKAKAKEEREKDRTTWFGTNLGEKGAATTGKRDIGSTMVGRYLDGPGTKGTAAAESIEAPEDFFAEAGGPAKKVKRQGGSFGNFSGW